MATSCLRCSADTPVGAASCPSCGGGGSVRLHTVERSPLQARLLQRLRAATSGEFEILREIGNGGMARVYLARELALGRQVAVKVLSPLFSEYPEIVRRFQHEARTAAQLSHPHIVPVFAVYQGSGLCFFTMPFVEGPSLREILNERGRVDLEEALEYLRQAAAALAYAHEHGVVHRDVKPENMLLERSTERLVLTDFGLAKALGGESLTVPGDMIGTPQYMAPEQCEGSGRVDGRSDQYSLALVAYEMLSGEYPFAGDGVRELLMKRLSVDPPPLRERRPDLPEHVSATIQRGMSRELNDRFPSIDVFLRSLMGTACETEPAPRRRGFSLLSGSLAGVARTNSAPPGTAGESQSALRMPAFVEPWKMWVLRGTVVVVAAASCYLAIAAMSGTRTGLEASAQPSTPALTFVDGEPDAGASDIGPIPPGDALESSGASELAGRDREDTPGPTADRVERVDAAVVAPRAARPIPPTAASSARQTRRVAREATGSTERGAGGAGQALQETAGDDATPVATERDDPPLPAVADAAAEEAGASRPGDGAATGATAPPEALLEAYRTALQDEDIEALQALHAGELPAAEARFLEKMFESAEQIQAGLRLLDVQIAGPKATIDVDFPLSYVLSKTKWSQQHTLKLRLSLQRVADVWKIDGASRR